MLSILLTLLIFSPTLVSAQSADLVEARQAGADVLRATLGPAAVQDDDATRLNMMLTAGEAAADALEGSVLGDEVRAMVAVARRNASSARGAATEALEIGLARVLADLEFEPVMEAALPEGFPAPTPVGEVELKRYPLYRLAKAGSGGNGAFWQLFNHIKKHDIPMTAPVEMTYDATGDEVEMAFMYEHARQGQVGQDGSVEVTDVEPMLVVSIGCRGYSSQAAVAEAVSKLTEWLAARDDVEIAGPMRQFGYNGPSVRGGRRYFEVQIPVRETQPAPVGAEREVAAVRLSVVR